jgi:hypothetical protein
MRTVLLSAVVSTLLLALPAVLGWAGKEGRGSTTSLSERVHEAQIRAFSRLPRFYAVERPADLSPFGPGFRPDVPEVGRRHGLVETSIGFVDLRSPAALERVPADLRLGASETTEVRGKGRFGPDVNLVQISAGAVTSLGYAEIESQVRGKARILGVAPERGLIVRADGVGAMEELASLELVEAVDAFHPAYKIGPGVGRIPLLQRSRAQSRTLELVVSTWPGADLGAAGRHLERIVGAGNVAPYSLDGSVFLVRARTPEVARIARGPEIAGIHEREEYVLMNSEVPTTVMIGNYEESLGGGRPYHELGIDGGGLDTGTSRGSLTTPDGRRLNDGSDAVPPQIVAVTDNGVSYDAVAFSQTATQTATLEFPVGTMFHRKVHAIQTVEDSGSTCDALLSGSGTHGNVVAGVIAGNPGELGFRYSKAIDPSDGFPIQNITMDALARGARIIMQDAANPNRCTLN